MTVDEFEQLDDGQYFTPLPFREGVIEPERKRKAPDPEAPNSRSKFLRKVADDANESHSTRDDARRLLQVAGLRPRDFDREYEDFLAWRSETKQ
jgi:hypothetical protein